jgi:hypothetical protein
VHRRLALGVCARQSWFGYTCSSRRLAAMSTTAPSAGCVTLATKSVPYQRCCASFVPCPSEACSAGFEFRNVCVAPKGAGCSRGALLIFACHVTSPAFKAFKGPGGMIGNIGVFRLYLCVCGWVLLRYGSVSVSVSVCWTGVCGRACCKADVPRDGRWGGGCPAACVTLCLATVVLLTGFLRSWVFYAPAMISWSFCVMPPTTSPVLACACSHQLHAQRYIGLGPCLLF